MNIGLMMAVVFSICYQSIHAFSHALKNDATHHESHVHQNTDTLTIKFTEKEDCPLCDFVFAAFLPMQMLDIAFYKHYYQLQLALRFFDHISVFTGSSLTLRGPPILNYY